MKTSMLGERHRKVLVATWPQVIARGVSDEGGESLFPGDLVRLPACIRWGKGEEEDIVGTVVGFAVGKDGSPSVVVYGSAHNGRALDSWHTWIVNGDFCNKCDEREAKRLVRRKSNAGAVLAESSVRSSMPGAWMQLMVAGVSTKAGVAIQPGDLLRLPRNVARNRRSQLHAAGTCLGYAVGLDGSPCVVVDAVGEDVPTLTRWRTWIVRGSECLVIDGKEAWRLEGLYQRDGRLRPKQPKQRR